MKKLRNLLITVIAIASFSTSLFAFEGFSIGGVYSSNELTTSGTETKNQRKGATTSMETSGIAKKVSDVDIGSIFAEYTVAQGSTFGVEYISGETTLGAKSRTHTLNALGQDVSGVITAKAAVSGHTTFYAEPTFMMTPTFGVYLKGGLTRVDVKSQESQTATTASLGYGDKKVVGIATGFGAKVYRGSLFAKLEYLETEYGTVTLRNAANKVITADIDSEATRISLGYNF